MALVAPHDHDSRPPFRLRCLTRDLTPRTSFPRFGRTMAEDNSDDTPTDTAQSSSTAAGPGKKRCTSTNPSSRGVANLTPEQLARKRANDREAQRAIRERTKNQIDRLNNRIRELESQQPYHELQIALRQKEAIQAENEDIRKRLASILSIIQPILSTQGLNGM